MLDLVHQYVIPISLEPSMEALLSKIIHKEQITQHNEKTRASQNEEGKENMR